MAVTKKKTARRIRSHIVDPMLSFEQAEENASQSKVLSEAVANVATVIENITIQEQARLDALLERLAEEPQTAREDIVRERRVFSELIKVMALLQKRLEKTPDDTSRRAILASMETFRGNAERIQDKRIDEPRSLKERLAAYHGGFSPREVREKGLMKTIFHSFKKVYGNTPPQDIDAMVAQQAEKLADTGPSNLLPNTAETIKAKTESNSMNLAYLEQMMSELLVETTVIRKIVEGSVRYNPLSKIKYEESKVGTNPTTKEREVQWGTRKDTMDFLTSPGMGVGRRRSSENKKISGAGIASTDPMNENVISFASLDFTKKPTTPGLPAFSPVFGSDTIDEFNENVQRDTTLTPREKKTLIESQTVGGGASAAALESSVSSANTTTADASGSGVGNALAGAAAARGIAGIAGKIKKTPVPKGVGKGVGKGVLKKIPGIGLVMGLGYGAYRLSKGDGMGAAGEVLSGIASTAPGLGTGISTAIDAGLILRDAQSGIDTLPNTAADSLMQATTPTMDNAAQTSPPAVIDNRTINNYNTTGRATQQDTIGVPSIRPTDSSFIRFQDKRMTRIM
jgi:hypothetical protein